MGRTAIARQTRGVSAFNNKPKAAGSLHWQVLNWLQKFTSFICVSYTHFRQACVNSLPLPGWHHMVNMLIVSQISLEKQSSNLIKTSAYLQKNKVNSMFLLNESNDQQVHCKVPSDVFHRLVSCCFSKQQQSECMCCVWGCACVKKVSSLTTGTYRCQSSGRFPEGGLGADLICLQSTRPRALNKQTHSLTCYLRWSSSRPLYRNNHFQSPQLNTVEPKGFGITEWEQCSLQHNEW